MNLTKRVLVVDDDSQIRTLLSSLLERESIQVYTAASAEEALGIIRKCGQQHIQVLLTDISLPGMDGLTLCRKLRRIEPLIVTIAITGYTDLFSLLECREAGFDDYLIKPVSASVLRAALVSSFKRARYWGTIAERDIASRHKSRPNGINIT